MHALDLQGKKLNCSRINPDYTVLLLKYKAQKQRGSDILIHALSFWADAPEQ